MDSNAQSSAVSVVICTRNRVSYLKRLLISLEKQDYQKNVQVVVVDNGSTDGTPEFLRRNNIEHVTMPGGIASARQAGVDHAKGEIICMTDDDCIVPGNWVSSIVESFAQHPEAVIIGGQVVNRGGAGVQRLKGRARMGINCAPEFVRDQTKADHFGNANLAIRADILREIGGYDPAFSHGHEETDLTIRARKLGEVVFDPTVTITHEFLGKSEFRMSPFLNRETMRYRLFFKHYRPQSSREWCTFLKGEALLLGREFASIEKRYQRDQSVPVALKRLAQYFPDKMASHLQPLFVYLAKARQALLTMINLLLIPYTCRAQLKNGRNGK